MPAYMGVDVKGAELQGKMLVLSCVWFCDVQLFSFHSLHTTVRRHPVIVERWRYQYASARIVYIFLLNAYQTWKPSYEVRFPGTDSINNFLAAFRTAPFLFIPYKY